VTLFWHFSDTILTRMIFDIFHLVILKIFRVQIMIQIINKVSSKAWSYSNMTFYLQNVNTPGVNFINVFRAHFSYKSLLSSFSLRSYIRLCVFGTKFVQKTREKKCWWNWRRLLQLAPPRVWRIIWMAPYF